MFLTPAQGLPSSGGHSLPPNFLTHLAALFTRSVVQKTYFVQTTQQLNLKLIERKHICISFFKQIGHVFLIFLTGLGSAHLLEHGTRVDPATLIPFHTLVPMLDRFHTTDTTRNPALQRQDVGRGVWHTPVLRLGTTHARGSRCPLWTWVGGTQHHCVPVLFLGLQAVTRLSRGIAWVLPSYPQLLCPLPLVRNLPAASFSSLSTKHHLVP